jgi:hypothetical protein
MSYLQDISAAGQNMGGIVHLQVARAAEIVSIPEPIDSTIYGDITFTEGFGFSIWDVVPNLSEFEANTRTTEEGPSKQNSFKFFIPKDRATIKAMLDKAELDEFVVSYLDSNGSSKIYGLTYKPVRFRYNHKTASYNGLAGYECEFYFEGPDNSYFYDGLTPAPSGTAPAIIKYANGTIIAQLYAGDIIVVTSAFSMDFELIPFS